MPIGEFGGAAALPGDGGPFFAAPMYWLYEMGQAALDSGARLRRRRPLFFKNPANPLAHTTYGKSAAAAFELFERSTRRYSQPEWGIDSTLVGGERVPVHITPVWERPFCRLLHFERAFDHAPRRPQPKLLIVAPMSGHYATLLRGTVEAFLPNHDVYITEWVDARMVPLADGRFDLDDYIDYVISMLHVLGGDDARHRGVPALGAGAGRGRADGSATTIPTCRMSMTLMGGPIDTRDQSDRGQQARRGARHRLVPPQRHHQGAVPASGLHARRLSGLPAAQRLRQHEPRPPHRGAPRPVPSIWSRATATRRRSTASSTTSIWR